MSNNIDFFKWITKKKLFDIVALIVILGGCREPTFTQCLNDY